MSKKPTLSFFPQLSTFDLTPPPKPQHDKNLSPTIYQPFLTELFKQLTDTDNNTPFVLSGSAAKQLQDDEARNPNDLDLLTTTEELVQANQKITNALQKMGLTPVYNNKEETLLVVYQGTTIQIELIDKKTSPLCYPSMNDFSVLTTMDGILMLPANIIPEKGSDLGMSFDGVFMQRQNTMSEENIIIDEDDDYSIVFEGTFKL